DFLALDALDGERRRFDRGDDLFGARLGQFVRLIVDAVVLVAVEPRLERRRILGCQARVEGPVLFGAEGLALALAVDDYPERDRLHAARADAALDLVPQQGAQLIADQAVEHAARLVRIEQVVIELRGIGDRLFYGGRRNLVQQHAADLGLGLAQMIGDMPGDRLAFAVGVAGEIDVLLALGGALDLADYLLFALDYDVVGSETVLDIHTQLAFGQVHHMADRRHDLVIATEVTLDGFRLCGRFDDYEIFCHRSRRLQPPFPPSPARQASGGPIPPTLRYRSNT